MHIRTKEWEYFGEWLRFPKFRETRSAFLLYINATYYYLLPKKNMLDGEQQRLRGMLRSKLTPDPTLTGFHPPSPEETKCLPDLK